MVSCPANVLSEAIFDGTIHPETYRSDPKYPAVFVITESLIFSRILTKEPVCVLYVNCRQRVGLC
jgi:hypothetical protein